MVDHNQQQEMDGDVTFCWQQQPGVVRHFLSGDLKSKEQSAGHTHKLLRTRVIAQTH